ncbi:MAG TPA: DUF4145 domain-containing protein [Streptosporangiaceae bacterium]|nr:DUF4145 domain-containing protein [Streptosporangiaceae bacterium]
MTPVEGSVAVRSGRLRDRVMGCFRCDNCGALNIAIAYKWIQDVDPLAWLASKKFQDWKPEPEPEEPVWDFPDVPTAIAAAAHEAHACWYRDANRSAVLMARAVIEATAKNKGIAKGSLLDKVDAMSAMIRPHVRQGAHEVRLLGNDMAHGDFIRPVSEEDAKLVLTLMDEVLDDVYQSPARVARAQAAREARRQRQAMVVVLDGKVVPGNTTSTMMNAAKSPTSTVGLTGEQDGLDQGQ